MAIALARFVLSSAFRALGFGWALLGYNKVADGVYEVTRWFRIAYLPVWPAETMLMSPRSASALNLGAVIQTNYEQQVLELRPRNLKAIVRTLTMAWLVVPGPLVAAIAVAKSIDARGGSPIAPGVVLLGLVWFLGWAFI